jgi:hypothetical protein
MYGNFEASGSTKSSNENYKSPSFLVLFLVSFWYLTSSWFFILPINSFRISRNLYSSCLPITVQALTTSSTRPLERLWICIWADRLQAPPSMAGKLPFSSDSLTVSLFHRLLIKIGQPVTITTPTRSGSLPTQVAAKSSFSTRGPEPLSPLLRVRILKFYSSQPTIIFLPATTSLS